MESDPLAVLLGIRLGVNLAFADLLDELSRNLKVMINQEPKVKSQVFSFTLCARTHPTGSMYR